MYWFESIDKNKKTSMPFLNPKEAYCARETECYNEGDVIENNHGRMIPILWGKEQRARLVDVWQI
jgi:hypothetical protein